MKKYIDIIKNYLIGLKDKLISKIKALIVKICDYKIGLLNKIKNYCS